MSAKNENESWHLYEIINGAESFSVVMDKRARAIVSYTYKLSFYVRMRIERSYVEAAGATDVWLAMSSTASVY